MFCNWRRRDEAKPDRGIADKQKDAPFLMPDAPDDGLRLI